MLSFKGGASLENQLKEMFPQESPEKIQGALVQGSQDLSAAVDYLLSGVMDTKGQTKTNI